MRIRGDGRVRPERILPLRWRSSQYQAKCKQCGTEAIRHPFLPPLGTYQAAPSRWPTAQQPVGRKANGQVSSLHLTRRRFSIAAADSRDNRGGAAGQIAETAEAY